jgi:hypothetical protein
MRWKTAHIYRRDGQDEQRLLVFRHDGDLSATFHSRLGEVGATAGSKPSECAHFYIRVGVDEF